MTEIVKHNPRKFGDWLSTHRKLIQAALPAHMTAERMIRVSMVALNQNPRLLQCTKESIYMCIMQGATLGLEIGTPLGHAYMVPYKCKIPGTEGQTHMVATFQVGYRGLTELAMRSAKISKIWARVVFENDEFDYLLGTKEYIKHRPHQGDDPGKPIGVYACAKHVSDVEPALVILWPRDVLARKNASRGAAKRDSPWNHDDWQWEMWKKTAVISLAKGLPVSFEMQRAVTSGDQEHLGLAAPTVVDIAPHIPAQLSLDQTDTTDPETKDIGDDQPPVEE